MNNINILINEFFKTNLGYNYLLKLISLNMPYLKINEANLKNLKLEEMEYEYFIKTGFVGEYVANKNLIKLLIVQDISKQDLIETFIHEFIHLLTSEYKDDMLFQGFNMIKDGNNSFFLGINEGITQMIAEIILNKKESDAYPFETNIARKLALIIGTEKLIELYSKHDHKGLMDEIKKIDKSFDVRELIIKVYYLHLSLRGFLIPDILGIGTQIEQSLISLSEKAGIDNTEEFKELIIDGNKALEMAHLVPNDKIVEFLYSDEDRKRKGDRK